MEAGAISQAVLVPPVCLERARRQVGPVGVLLLTLARDTAVLVQEVLAGSTPLAALAFTLISREHLWAVLVEAGHRKLRRPRGVVGTRQQEPLTQVVVVVVSETTAPQVRVAPA